jgi:PAS domain S-box-containing protein
MNPLQSVLGRDAVALRSAALALAGFFLTHAAVVYLNMSHQTPPVMPVEAIMLTVLLTTQGRRRWLYLGAIFVGYCAAGYTAGHSLNGIGGWASPIALSACTLTGPLVAYGLLRRFGAPPLDIAKPRDLALFGLAAGLAAPAATVFMGALVKHWLHHDGSLLGLSRWAIAESLGMLILGPGLLILRDSLVDFRRARLSKPGLAALLVLVLISLAAFGQSRYGLRFMIPPALALVAIYLEFLGVALGGIIVAAIAVGGAYLHQGLYASPAPDAAQRFLWIQIFLAFLMVVNLPFAALLVQRRRMREALILTKVEAEAARAEVVEQQRRSAMAEEIAKVGFWRADFRTGKVEWSDQNYAIFGRDPTDPPNLDTLNSYIHPDDRDTREAAFSRLQFGEPSMAALRIVRENGEIRHVVKRGVPEFGPDGSVCAAFGTVVDVTELTQAQTALAQSATQLRLITQNVADIILQTDLDNRITYISPAVEARLGYTPDEVLGSSWLDLIHPADAHLWSDALDHLLRARGEGLPDSIRCRVIAKDGREIWLAQRPALIFDDKTGAPAGFVDVARDITERNRMFAELQAAQAAAEKASKVKSDFLANMSHEIRTPLTSISGFTKLVENQGDLSEDTRRYIGHISSAASALVAIVNDVLDFSKLEAGEIRIEPRPTDVEAVMRDTVNLFSGKSQE